MSSVINEEVFGTVVAHLRVIEFQKRRLPHTRVLFFLDKVSKNGMRTLEKVDRIISAKISCAQDPELQEVVPKHMIHSPCGEHNPTAVCMREHYCRKGVSNSFKHKTSHCNSEYYIMYHRKSPSAGGVSIERPSRIVRRQQPFVVHNSWVVPSSPGSFPAVLCFYDRSLAT